MIADACPRHDGLDDLGARHPREAGPHPTDAPPRRPPQDSSWTSPPDAQAILDELLPSLHARERDVIRGALSTTEQRELLRLVAKTPTRRARGTVRRPPHPPPPVERPSRPNRTTTKGNAEMTVRPCPRRPKRPHHAGEESTTSRSSRPTWTPPSASTTEPSALDSSPRSRHPSSATTSSSSDRSAPSRSSNTPTPSIKPFTKSAGVPDPRAAQFDHLSLNLPDEDALIDLRTTPHGRWLRGHRDHRPRRGPLRLLHRPQRHRARSLVVGARLHRPARQLRRRPLLRRPQTPSPPSANSKTPAVSQPSLSPAWRSDVTRLPGQYVPFHSLHHDKGDSSCRTS